MNVLINRTMRLSVLLVMPLLLAADTPKEAIVKVQQGLSHFRGNDFADAESSFAEAAKLAPENYTIIFDEACAALAGGDADQARGLFQKATQADDAGLAVRAHYNLGCLESDQARAKLGDDPAAAEGEVRTESIDLLLTSVRHYRDVLRFDSEHGDARHNLELIRLFIKHIQSQWAERDKQKARDEKDLLQFLKMIEDRETGLRDVVKNIRDEDDSVSKRKIVRDTVDAQDTLLEEIEPLKQKITQQIQASQQQQQPAAGAGQAAVPDDQTQQMEQLLHQIADAAGEGMQTASKEMAAANFDSAFAAQSESLGQLNQLYMAIAPYQNILQRSLKQQSELVSEEDGAEATTEETENTEASEAHSPPSADPVQKPAVDEGQLESDRESQAKISDWSRMLTLKAEAELPQVQQQLGAMQPTDEAKDDEKGSEDAGDPQDEAAKDAASDEKPEAELTEVEKAAKAQQDQVQQQRKQLQGLVKSMELAIELGPEAEEHSRAADVALTSQDVEKATPEQQETLRILKEIAEPLKQDQQDEQDQQQQNDDQNQQGDQDQQQEDQQKNEQDQQGKSEEQKPESGKDPQQQEADQQESKKQQAESTLRQARERERERRERDKKMREILMQGFKVEKDW